MVKLANLSNWGFYPLCFTYRLLFLEEGKWPFSPVVSGTWLRSSYQVTNGWEMFTTTMDSATKIRTECSQFFSYLRLPPPVTLPAVIYLGFLSSHWSRVITWSGYWPLIGHGDRDISSGQHNQGDTSIRRMLPAGLLRKLVKSPILSNRTLWSFMIC